MAFMRVAEEGSFEPVEVPCEEDGTVLLSTIAAQFAGTIGLKYRNFATNHLRGVRLSDGRLYPPEDGWGSRVFFVVVSRTAASKAEVEQRINTESQAICAKQCPTDSKSTENDSESVCQREIASALKHIDQPGDPFVEYAAGILHAIACDSDSQKRAALAEMRVTAALARCAVRMNRQETLVSLLRPLSVLTAHSNENKRQLLDTDGSLDLLIESLKLCRVTDDSPQLALSTPAIVVSASNVDRMVGELAGVVLRNVSSVVALDESLRAQLRAAGCFELLLTHLRASSLRVVANAAGTLWNLTAKHAADQQRFVDLGARGVLRSLTSSRHRAIAAASRAALKNLANVGGSRMVRPAYDAGSGAVPDSSSMFFRPNGNDNFIFSSAAGGGDGQLVGIATASTTDYESGSLLRLRRARDEQVEKERALQMAETCDHLDDGTASASASESASASDGEADEPEPERNALIEIESAVRNRLSRKTTSSNVNPVVNQAVLLMHNCMVDDDTEAEGETAEKGDSRYVTQLNVMNDAVGNRVVVFDDEAEAETETDAEGASESDEQLVAPIASRFRFPLAPLSFPPFTSDPNTTADASAFAEGDLITRALGDLEVDSVDGTDADIDEIDQAAIDACIASASAPATLKRNAISNLYSPRTPTLYSARTPTENSSMWTSDSDRIMVKSFLKSPTEPDVGIAVACNSRRCSSYKIELRVGLSRNADDLDGQADANAERLASPSGDLVRVFATEDSLSDVSSDCVTHTSAGVGASPLVRNGTFSIRRECGQSSSTTCAQHTASPSGVNMAVAACCEIESAATPDIIREHSFGKASPDSDASSSNANVVSTPMPLQRRATVTVLSALEDVNAMQLMPSTNNMNNDSSPSSRSPSLISLSQSLPDDAASPTLPAPVPLPTEKSTDKQTKPLNRVNPQLKKTNANPGTNPSTTPRNDARATPNTSRKLPVAPRPREADRPQTASARTATQKSATTQVRTERTARTVPPKPTSTTNLANKSKTIGPSKIQPSTSASADMKRVVGAAAITKPVPVKRLPAKPTSAKVAGRVAAKPSAPGAPGSRPSTATTASNPTIAASAANASLSTFQNERDSLRSRPTPRRVDRPYQRIPTSTAQIQRLETAAERKIVSSFECVPIDLEMPIELTSSLSSSSDSLDVNHSRFSKPCTPNLPTGGAAVKRPSLSQVNTSVSIPPKSKFLKSPSASTSTLKSPSVPMPRKAPPSNSRPPLRSIGVKSPPTTKRVTTTGNTGTKPRETATVQTPLQRTADCCLPSPSDRAATCPSSPTVTTAPSNVLIPNNALSTDNQLFQLALVQIDTDTPQSTTKHDHEDPNKSKEGKVGPIEQQPERPPSSSKRVSVVDRLAAFFKPKSTNRNSPNKSNTSTAREQPTDSATPLVPPPMINRSTSQPTDQLASVTSETTTSHSRSSTMPFSENSGLRQLSTPDSMPIADLWITREGVCTPNSATVTVTVAASAVHAHSEVDSVNLIDVKGHTGSLRSTPTSKQLSAVRRAGTASRATRNRPPIRDVISGESIFSHSQQRPDVLPIGESSESQHSVVAKGGRHSHIATG